MLEVFTFQNVVVNPKAIQCLLMYDGEDDEETSTASMSLENNFENWKFFLFSDPSYDEK